MNIYVGNLSFETDEDELRKIFDEFGAISRVTILKDKFSGKSRGFGFVEMENNNEAQAAIDALNGKQIGGRTLKVNEAQPRTEGGPSGDRGPRRSGGPRH